MIACVAIHLLAWLSTFFPELLWPCGSDAFCKVFAHSKRIECSHLIYFYSLFMESVVS